MNNLLDPVFGVIEDFWFYKYHAENYPYFVDALTREMDIMNFLKIKPSFLDNFAEVTTFQQHASLYENISYIHEKAPEERYFLEAIKDVYTYNFIKTLIAFVILNLVHACISNWKHKRGILKATFSLIYKHAAWWNLPILLIDTNLAFTTFSGFVQLLMPACFSLTDKLNLITTIFYLFLNLLFPFVLYTFVYRLVPKKRGSLVLNLARFTRRGFILELLISSVRNFCRSAIHAFFLDHYYVQILGLVVCDILLVLICFIFRKEFLNKGLLFGNLLYYLSFLGFDVLLFTRHIKAFP